MGTLKSEYKSFLDDIEKNIKNKEDLEYIKKRFSNFLDIMLDQMDYISEYKKEQIDALVKEVINNHNKITEDLINGKLKVNSYWKKWFINDNKIVDSKWFEKIFFGKRL